MESRNGLQFADIPLCVPAALHRRLFCLALDRLAQLDPARIQPALQIYYDFAGYSNMAIGLGFLIGFGFPRNFDLPYTSGSVTEFWRRWHMNLSRWFRDYLYIPLAWQNPGGETSPPP